MIFILVYLGIGILLSGWVLVSRPKPKNPELSPLSFLTEPYVGWILFLIWPLWLAFQILDRDIEVTAAPQEYLSEELTGHTGEVVLELRPTGRVRVDGKLYDARSNGDILPVGTSIIVSHCRLGELKVDKVVGVETES